MLSQFSGKEESKNLFANFFHIFINYVLDIHDMLYIILSKSIAEIW